MKNIVFDISNFIFISNIPERVDAIFLPGGSHPAQPEYAAQLFLNGYAKIIVPAGGISIKRDKWPGVQSKADIYNGDYRSDCDFFTDVLVKNGVPAKFIIGENRSSHTRDNAFFSKELLEEQSIDIQTGMVVCKAFHARRCLMLYQMAFPNVHFIVCPIHCYNITKENWYQSEQGIHRVMGELARCGNQFVDDFKQFVNVDNEH